MEARGGGQAACLDSLSKSFNSTAVGLAIAEGKLSLDDPVLKFFPADAPADPSDNLKAMTVRDLLTMTCGHDTEPKAAGGGPSVKQFLAHPVPHKPGTHFQYNTHGQLHALGHRHQGDRPDHAGLSEAAIVRAAGHRESPMGRSSPEGNSLGGYGLKLRTEDIAKFGQLYLQKGKWNGKQLIPEEWVGGGRRASRCRTTRKPTRRSASTGSRATASSSGDAPTTPFAATAPAANSAS